MIGCQVLPCQCWRSEGDGTPHIYSLWPSQENWPPKVLMLLFLPLIITKLHYGFLSAVSILYCPHTLVTFQESTSYYIFGLCETVEWL